MRLAALLALATLSGCTYSVTFRSSPPGARVFVDGNLVGVTPITVDMPEGTPYLVRMELEGYEPATKQVKPEVTTLYVGGVPDPGPRPVYDVNDPGTSNVEALDYAARENRAFVAAASGNTSRRWPREVSLTLSPHAGTAWPATPSSPAPRTPPPAQSSPPPPPAPTRSTFCGSCGARLGGGRFCGGCGSRVDAPR